MKHFLITCVAFHHIGTKIFNTKTVTELFNDSSADKISSSPILRIGDQVLTFDVFWPKHLQEVRSTVCIHVQSI